jgi:hypothetical protein
LDHLNKKPLKTVAIHQPNFMPWLGYFYKIAHCDVFVILDNVDFQQGNHNSITNRTKIKCNGEEKFFTICVKKNHESKLIMDISIDKQATNIKKQLKTILFNYPKADYFKEFYPQLETQINEALQQDSLSELNIAMIKFICELLQIKTPIVKASELDLKADDRNERIVEICKSLNGDVYFSGNGGKKYHDEALFISNGINIKYTDFKPVEYKQVGDVFLPGLSILDVLMNCGIQQTINFIK